MKCKGQKFGHSFPYAGASCLGCGVNQLDLNPKPVKIDIEYKIPEKKRNSNPRQDLLERLIIEYFDEKKNFKKMLIQLMRYSNGEINTAWSWLKDSKRCGKVKDKGIGLFFWKLKNP